MKDVSPQVAVGLLKVPISNTLLLISIILGKPQKKGVFSMVVKRLPLRKKELFLGCFFLFPEKILTAITLEGGGGGKALRAGP